MTALRFRSKLIPRGRFPKVPVLFSFRVPSAMSVSGFPVIGTALPHHPTLAANSVLSPSTLPDAEATAQRFVMIAERLHAVLVALDFVRLAQHARIFFG